MKVIEFIREKREKFWQQNAEFRARLQPSLKDISAKLNERISNTLNNPWLSRFTEADSASNEPKQLIQSPEAAKLYRRLQEKLGEETYVGEWFTVKQECIDKFAEVTGDHQWIHTDPERAAKESPFKTTIAHGFLTLSLVPQLTDAVNEDHNPYPEARMVVNYGLNQVRFPYPVKSGSRVRARVRLIELVPMRKSIEVVNEVSVEIENSKRLACVAETVLRLYF